MSLCTLGLSLLAAGPEIGDDPLDYGALARGFLERHGIEAAEGAGAEALESLLERNLLRFQLGGIDFRIPPAPLKDAGWTKELREVFRGVAQGQSRLLGWLPESGAGKDGIPKDLKTVLKTVDLWLRDWAPNELVSLDDQPGVALMEALSPKEKVLEAAAEFTRVVVEQASFAGRAGSTRLLLMPDRDDFVEFCYVIGWLRPELRPIFWIEDVQGWTYYDYEDSKVVALAFSNPHTQGDYASALDMNFKNERAMAEHVTQLSVLSLIEATLGNTLDPALIGALANILVVDVFGEVDTRNDGDQRARITDEISVFVPGALSDGVLPAVSADSRWRADQGSDYFVRVLFQVQKDGENEAETRDLRVATFPILSDDRNDKTLLHAPFFGPGAMVPPDGFRGDFIEFLRAYRVAFLHWLRAESQGSAKKSGELFGELLARLATEPETHFVDVIESVYGKPLSGETFDRKTLEGEFLVWLQKQK